VLEEPLYLGDTTARRLGSASDFSEHKNAVLDIEAEIKLAFDYRRQSENSATFHKEMKYLGIQRYILYLRCLCVIITATFIWLTEVEFVCHLCLFVIAPC
jgi:hypothetical protein